MAKLPVLVVVLVAIGTVANAISSSEIQEKLRDILSQTSERLQSAVDKGTVDVAKGISSNEVREKEPTVISENIEQVENAPKRGASLGVLSGSGFTCPSYSASGGSYDTCSFAACGGSVITISGCGSCNGDQYLSLYDSNNNIVASNDDGCGGVGCSLINTYSVPGEPTNCPTYTIHEGCYSTNSCSGTVSVSVTFPEPTPDPTPSPATSMTCDSYSASNTSYARRNTSTCSFEGCPGQTVILSDCGACSGDSYLRVYRDGSQVSYGDDGCGDTFCTYMSFMIPSYYSNCVTYTIQEGCFGNSSCSGKVLVSASVVGSSPTPAPTSSPTWPPGTIISTTPVFLTTEFYNDYSCTIPEAFVTYGTNLCTTATYNDLYGSMQYLYVQPPNAGSILTAAYYYDSACATTSDYSLIIAYTSNFDVCEVSRRMTLASTFSFPLVDGYSSGFFTSHEFCSANIPFIASWLPRFDPFEDSLLRSCVAADGIFFSQGCTGNCAPLPPPPPVRSDTYEGHSGPTGHGPHGSANGDMAKPGVMFSVTPYTSVDSMNMEWHCLEFDYMSGALKSAHGTYNNLGYFEGAFMGNTAYVSYYENTLSADGRMFYPSSGAGVISYDPTSSYAFTSGTYWAAGKSDLYPWAEGLHYCPDCMPDTSGWTIHDWVKLARTNCLWSPYDSVHEIADDNLDNLIFGPKGFQNVWETAGIGPFETNGSTIGAYTYTYSQEECDMFEQSGKASCADGNLELGHYQLNAISSIVGRNRVFVSLWNATTGPLRGQVGPMVGLFQTNAELGSSHGMSQSEFNGIFCYLDTDEYGMVSPTGCTSQDSRFKREDRNVAKYLMSAYDSYRGDKESGIYSLKRFVNMIWGNGNGHRMRH